MKRIMSGWVVIFGLVLSASAASAGPAFSEAQLEALNNEHGRAVRQAQRACSAGFHRGFVRYNHRNPCVIADVEHYVRSQDNDDLLEFHKTLPQRYRYDTQRGMNDVRRFFN